MPLALTPPQVDGVTHRRIDVGTGVSLHVAEAGQGPTLILLHGWPQHWWSWRHVIPTLATKFHLVVPDLRGWGWSDAPSGSYAKAAMAADILGLMDREGFERVSVLGHDWGGYVAMLLALERPDRIERVVALDIAPPWAAMPQPRHLAAPLAQSYQAVLATPVIGPLTMTRSPRLVRALIRGGSGRRMRWDERDLDTYARVLRRPARAKATSACYRTFLTRELPEAIRRGDRSGELEVPTLLVMGGDSPLRRVINPSPSANVRVEQIAGAGHFLPEEAPNEVLELALPFLGDAKTDRPEAGAVSNAR